MLNELKPCPFCGNQNIQTLVDDDDSVEYSMICTKCRANGPWKTTDQLARDAWNKRR